MSNLHIEENVGVHTVAGRTLYVDIFHPENPPGPVPSLLFLPGGGWRTADRASLKERFGMRMAEHGYLFVAAANAMAFFMARYASAAMASASPNH